MVQVSIRPPVDSFVINVVDPVGSRTKLCHTKLIVLCSTKSILRPHSTSGIWNDVESDIEQQFILENKFVYHPYHRSSVSPMSPVSLLSEMLTEFASSPIHHAGRSAPIEQTV